MELLSCGVLLDSNDGMWEALNAMSYEYRGAKRSAVLDHQVHVQSGNDEAQLLTHRARIAAQQAAEALIRPPKTGGRPSFGSEAEDDFDRNIKLNSQAWVSPALPGGLAEPGPN